MDFRRTASRLGYVRWRALAVVFLLPWAVTACSHERADAPRLAELVGVRPGMVVADVGAGRGAAAVAMARMVGPKGHVFAVDVEPHTLDHLRGAVKAARLGNLTVVAAGPHASGLPGGCCEAIFLRRIYHEMDDHSAFDASLMRALRPEGDLAVLDFRPTSPWPWQSKAAAGKDGIDPVVVVNQVTGAGFEYIRMVDPWPGSWFVSSYCLLFKKPPQGPAPTPPSPGAAPDAGASPPAR